MIVIDASATLALLLNEDNALAAAEAFTTLTEQTVVAPNHWSAEVGNALVINVRRGRLDPRQIRYMLDRLSTLGIQLEPSPSFADIASIADRATALNLTYYDAAYVHSAQSHQASLFTFDRGMREAANRLKIPLLPQ